MESETETGRMEDDMLAGSFLMLFYVVVVLLCKNHTYSISVKHNKDDLRFYLGSGKNL